jgi:hypothetical protein
MTSYRLTPHFYSNGEALHNLIASHTDDMHSDYAFLRPNTNELVHRGLFVLFINLGEV